MHFEVTHDYPAGPDRVAQMLTDEAYVERGSREAGALRATQEIVRHEDGAFVISITRAMPSETIPASMRSLVGSSIELRVVQAWSPPNSVHARNATLTVDIAGAPARCTARAQLKPDGPDASTLAYIGEVSVPIPLLGPAVEQAVVKAITHGLETEHDVGLAYLAGE